MSIRNSLLAILSEEPTHGYGLKNRFETSTAGAWPLNVGQVYSTLQRLERDGLVEPLSSVKGSEDKDRQSWRLTDPGRDALARWFEKPILDDPPQRDELTLKVLLAAAAEHVDVLDILQAQRAATMERLQQYTQRKRSADPDQELSWVLLLDAFILRAKAEIQWLDLCEERLRHHKARPS